MSIDDRIRGEAMGRRVIRTARAAGVSPDGLSALELAHRAALRPRERLLDDDHDPHYLHPGRTALILMLDTGETDPVVLAAAALAETQRPDLVATTSAVRAGAHESGLPGVVDILERALGLRDRVPAPDAPDLVETVVVGEPALGLVTAAERLDHARHAHMWLEGPLHAELLDEYERHWGALADRVHPRLAQRFHRWARGTRKRLGR